MRPSERQGLRVLLLEDDPRDAELIVQTLRRLEPTLVVEIVEDRQAFEQALDTFEPDAVLSDTGGSQFRALDALRLLQRHRPVTPLLIVSGGLSQAGMESLKAGAADFVPKSDLGRLGAAIAEALEARAPLRRLSARQCLVLQRLALGHSTRQIAHDLHISVKTVETHRAELMRRLGIRDLAGLVRYAVRVGLVSADR